MKRLLHCLICFFVLAFVSSLSANTIFVQTPAGGGSCTLGNTTIESDVYDSANSKSYLYTASCSGTLTVGYLYDKGAQTDNAKLCIYLDDGDNTPEVDDTLVACSAVIVGDSQNNWVSNTFAGGSITNGNKYFLVLAADTTNFTIGRGAGTGFYNDSSYYAGPANMGTGTWGSHSYEYSMYATVTY